MQNTDKKIILAIDTSCDETAAAVLAGVEVLANVRFSQIEMHEKYGGVVPSIAKFSHQEKIGPIIAEAMEKAGKKMSDLDYIAVTYGPGLAIALEVGIAKAKELSRELNIPLLAINHMEGHLLSWLGAAGDFDLTSVRWPALGVLVSGGHTEFIRVDRYGKYEKVGTTLDDAAGEAFDKCGRMLGLPYPAGPHISRLAAEYKEQLVVQEIKRQDKKYIQGIAVRERGLGRGKGEGEVGRLEAGDRRYETGTDLGQLTADRADSLDQGVDERTPNTEHRISTSENPIRYELPIPMAGSDDANMSYAGLKTAFKNLVLKLGGTPDYSPGDELGRVLPDEVIGHLCVMFEAAALRVLLSKLEKAVLATQSKEVWLGGGVVASARLRSEVELVAAKLGIVLRQPTDINLMVDNAAMIGLAAAVNLISVDNVVDLAEKGMLLQPSELDKLDRNPGLSL